MADWQTEAEPVLRAIYEATERRDFDRITSTTIAEALDRESRSVARIMGYLADDGYIDVEWGPDQRTGEIEGELQQLHAKAPQVVAGWPAAGGVGLNSLVAAIDELMASAPPEEQKRLAAFREAAISLGARALADLVAKTAGL